MASRQYPLVPALSADPRHVLYEGAAAHYCAGHALRSMPAVGCCKFERQPGANGEPDVKPAAPFGFSPAGAIDASMAPEDRRLVMHPNTPPGAVAALRGIWCGEVLTKFAARYGLTS